VLVGSRSRTTGAIIDMLERCQIIKNHVIRKLAESSAGLCRLLSSARALLMPSFAKGFGLHH
jgi:hypothetical protein